MTSIEAATIPSANFEMPRSRSEKSSASIFTPLCLECAQGGGTSRRSGRKDTVLNQENGYFITRVSKIFG